MNKSFVLFLIVFSLLIASGVQAQSPESGAVVYRPRTITTAKITAPARAKNQEPATQSPKPSPAAESEKPSPRVQPSSEDSKASREESSSRRLSPNRIRTRINEAERLMKSRALPTAMNIPSLDYVTVAALLPETSQIHLIRLEKRAFLMKGSDIPATTSLGLPVEVLIIRANGVNTAVNVFDERNHALVPLVVEFPIERRGVFREMAYYTSAHPALLSSELTKAGQSYVNSMVDLAAQRLRDKGAPIPRNLVDVAKRLCIVEHVDHERFRNENRVSLFEEIYSLYALNELDTYRYSVSSAGAGGMVQMIPWAYQLERQRHPGVGLNPDFVLGMRNHGNALEAMLLYMQDTWADLLANEDVQSALASKQATQTELIAAAYNSNAAKLPGYIRRAGAGWRNLIPRETQLYLQIYQSLDSTIKAKDNHARKKS
jgi:hypothetical protein